MAVAPPRKRRRLSPVDDKRSTSTTQSQSGSVNEQFLKNVSGWNLEQNYESQPRRIKGKNKESTRLPIKTAEGIVQQVHVVPTDEDKADSWLESGEEDETAATSPEVVEVKPRLSSKQEILEAKEELARIASLINEDPEEHSGGFRSLAKVAETDNIVVKKLALATQFTVYRDVIPGYKIRSMGESDPSEKLSKEVRRLRLFEHSLVVGYQDYIKTLSKYAKGENSAARDGLDTVAVSCASALLLAVPHFNFSGQLIKIMVDKLSMRKIDANYRKCQETLETLFRDDEDGNTSLEAVTMLTKMIKGRNYRVDESVLNMLLHLRILSEMSTKGSTSQVDKAESQYVNGKKVKVKREFRTKKQRKELKEKKAVEKEFREADAVVSHEERDRIQAETLKLVFVCYFRILKARSPGLMGAVLEGLAKYAHLINQDFFGDILEVLKDLTAQAEGLVDAQQGEATDDDEALDSGVDRDSTREALLCVITAFALLEGQDAAKAASTLHLDLSYFTKHLYRSLAALSINPDLEFSNKTLRLEDPNGLNEDALVKSKTKVNVKTTSALLLRSLASTLLPRPTPPSRTAAFVHQLFIAALQTPEKTSIALMGLLAQITKVHGRKIASLWDTEERKGDGAFDPYRMEVEGSNPFAGTIWAGEILRLHYAKDIRQGINDLESIIGAAKD